MTSKAKTSTICFKRGDDFKLDFTVQDTNNTTAIAAAEALKTAQTNLTEAQNADPLVPSDVTTAEGEVVTTQAAYDAAIVVDITGWTMVSQVRQSLRLISDLTITIIDVTTGKFSISESAVNTQLWPVQTLDCDVQFTRPTGIVSSETFYIDVHRDVTQ